MGLRANYVGGREARVECAVNVGQRGIDGNRPPPEQINKYKYRQRNASRNNTL